ncbi:juvenile hormone esterase-like, partial [Leptopilina heterotoma]|uniref:juvenile hormone esterase-like n=1 Tax=Leptopilina heterotoma TaxID=63436 RepID=UPI001CA80B2E
TLNCVQTKDPQPPKLWEGVRDAKEGEGGVAPQLAPLINKISGQDDCLYLNVSTNNLRGKKAVMVWIHGGGFTNGSGSAEFYRPDYFMQHDVVFVSINYRLGMLGFLNMDIENCSGNQGLKDQVMALRWVQKNIEAFGGDQNNVTIFGQSGGSASIHYLLISPLAKGLFHKAIAQSGVGINPWAFQNSNKENAMKVAAELGCASSNKEEIAQFLRSVPAEKILVAQNKVFDEHPFKLEFHFVPTVDNKCPNPFLPKPLSEMIESGVDVPLIIGYTSDEGIFALGSLTLNSGEGISKLLDNFEECLSKDLKINLSTASKFSKEVREFYFGENVTKSEQDNFVQYKGDTQFVTYWKSDCRNRVQHIYTNFRIVQNFPLCYSFIILTCACHAEDMAHMFYKASLPSEMQLQKGSGDYLIMQRITRMWTDFAKTGNPTPKIDDLIKCKWSAYNSDNKCCQHISDDFKTENSFEEISWKLWGPIYRKYKLF